MDPLASRLINTCTSMIKSKYAYAYPNQDFPYRVNNVLECEFYLLENMDCCLIVFQPYRSAHVKSQIVNSQLSSIGRFQPYP